MSIIHLPKGLNLKETQGIIHALDVKAPLKRVPRYTLWWPSPNVPTSEWAPGPSFSERDGIRIPGSAWRFDPINGTWAHRSGLYLASNGILGIHVADAVKRPPRSIRKEWKLMERQGPMRGSIQCG